MVDPKSGSDNYDSSGEEAPQKTQEELNKMLLDAVKLDNFAAAQEAISEGADVYCEENGWNSLLWAACNGNEAIVRLLIKNRAHEKYLENDKEVNEGNADEEEEKDEAETPKELTFFVVVSALKADDKTHCIDFHLKKYQIDDQPATNRDNYEVRDRFLRHFHNLVSKKHVKQFNDASETEVTFD